MPPEPIPGDCVFGLKHVAGAGQDQGRRGVGDDHHGFEAAQETVGAPVLGEFDGGAGQLAGVLLELGFEAFEQGEGVGGRTGKAADDVALAEAANLAGVRFDDRLPEAHLAVAGNYNSAALANGQDRGGVPGRIVGIWALVGHMYRVS